MIYVTIILLASMLIKHIIRNGISTPNRSKEHKLELDLGDIILTALLVIKWFAPVNIGASFKLDIGIVIKIILSVLSIILINRLNLIVFKSRLKYFRSNPQISAGGVHHLIKDYKGIKFLVLSFITTASGSFLEEVVFRSGLTAIFGLILVKPHALIVQALIFGLSHALPMYIGGADIKMAIMCFVATSLDGMILGNLFINYGILSSWICHWCVNFMALISYDKIDMV